MASIHRPTRRRLLGLGAAGFAGLLAGCSGRGGPMPSPDRPAIEDTSFEGTDLLVELAEDHRVSSLELYGPDGDRFAKTEVSSGATTGRLELLDVRPLLAGFKHYTPGTHELVAVREGEDQSLDIELEPALRIVDVGQYREGEAANDLGKLVVEVENVGTGPTWVYDIAYQNAPNPAANGELSQDPGVLVLGKPTNTEEVVIHPNATVQYIGVTLPIVFNEDEMAGCEGSFEMMVVVGSAASGSHSKPVDISVSGKTTSSGLTGQFTCSEVSIGDTNPGGLNG